MFDQQIGGHKNIAEVLSEIHDPPVPKKMMAPLYPDTGNQCSQLILATLVPSTPICLFFNLAKLLHTKLYAQTACLSIQQIPIFKTDKKSSCEFTKSVYMFLQIKYQPLPTAVV